MSFPALPLEMLPAGAKAMVDELVGLPEEISRLQELGLRAGRSIEMVQSGSPCIVRVDGHKLCIRQGDAFGVLVRPEVA